MAAFAATVATGASMITTAVVRARVLEMLL